MWTSIGHSVTLFAGEQNEAECAEHVVCITEAERAALFGDAIPVFDANAPGWRLFAERAIPAIRARAEPGDFLCLIAGQAQKPIADAFPDLIHVEFACGYGGILDTSFVAFESQAWRHTVMGARSGGDAHSINGRFYDCVIANSWDPGDFPAGKGDGGYLLYMGRLIERKGLGVVRDIVARTGIPLVVAGAGDTSLLPPGADYRGVVGPKERAELMGGAIALAAPSIYVEPFGGVCPEAQLTGTPVISVPWGAFPETVEDGKTGYLCSTLAEFCQAVVDAPTLDRDYIRERAIRLYSMETAAIAYRKWFERLAGLRGAGWYS